MNAPILWIGIPILTALILWVIRNDERKTLLIGLGASLFFVITAIILPIGKPFFRIGNFAPQIFPSISLLGRSFTLENGDLVYTALLYLILFLFLCMSFVIEIPPKFIPIGFLLTSLFLAALSVQPFLYAALLLEICVLLAVLLISPFGEPPTTGVTRFLIFQTLAMPFMLAAGWVLSAVEANPTETILIIQALVLLGLGFAFWLAVFPFNSWMPQLAGEKPSFLVGFVLLLFNTVTLILVLRYLDGFVWLRDDARIFTVLQYLGILMVVSSAVFFFFEKNKYRTVAYLLSYETGMSLLSLSLNQSAGWSVFILMFLPRILSISLWIALLSYMQQNIDQEEENRLLVHPVIITGFAIAALTIAGLPMLPEFVSRLVIYEYLSKINFAGFFWVCSANIIFIIASIRLIRRLYSDYSIDNTALISKVDKGYFIISCILIGLIGILPQFLLRGLLSMLQAFPNIK